jgi:hypothetical protein
MRSMRVEERILIQIIKQGTLVKEGRYIIGPSFPRLATENISNGNGSQEKRIKSGGFHMGLKSVWTQKKSCHLRNTEPTR